MKTSQDMILKKTITITLPAADVSIPSNKYLILVHSFDIIFIKIHSAGSLY